MVGGRFIFLIILAVDEGSAVMQTAYRIVVAGPSGIVWDTGKTQSAAQSFIEYEGTPLSSRGIYECTVTVWDNHGECAYAKSSLEMALLDRSEWKASWIKSSVERVPAVSCKFGQSYTPILFRRSFTLQGKQIPNTRESIGFTKL